MSNIKQAREQVAMARRYGVGITDQDASLLRQYAKSMVGKGWDPLPEYDVPLEIEGGGISSVFKLMVPLVKQAVQYGKPLAKKIGKMALGALASAAAKKLSDSRSEDDDPDTLPGKHVLDGVMSRGKQYAIDRAQQLKNMGVDKLQASVDSTINQLQARSNDAIDQMQARARGITAQGQATVSTGIASIEARARARLDALRGSGIDHEEAHVMAYMGSGVRFADTSGGPRPGVRVALNTPGAFVSGRVLGSGMYRPGAHVRGSGMYSPGAHGGGMTLRHGPQKKRSL
jgi:hypothetical protein